MNNWAPQAEGTSSHKPGYVTLGNENERLITVVEQFRKAGFEERYPWYEHDWDVLWSFGFPFEGERPITTAGIRAGQLINHFPKSPFTIKSQLAKEPFPFIPLSFEIPHQIPEFVAAYQDYPDKQWVRKNAGHRGVQLTSPHETELFIEHSDHPFFVQEYVAPPHLIYNRKWDIGIYVLLTSLKPLRLYAYSDVALRFCSGNYPKELDPTDVTSYVITDDYTSPWDLEAFEFHRQSNCHIADMLDDYFAQQSSPLDWKADLRSQCFDAVYKIVTHYAEDMFRHCADYPSGQYQFFELYRFDFIFDHQLRVHLLEANMSPNLSARAHPQLEDLFTRLSGDVFQLVGINKGLDFHRAKHLDTAFAGASERASCERWVPLPHETVPSASNRAPILDQTLLKQTSTHHPFQSPPTVPITHQFSFQGAMVQVELPSSVTPDALYDLLPPGVSRELVKEADVVYRVDENAGLFRNSELRLRARTTQETLEALVSDLHYQLACLAQGALYVHACVVVLEGKAIVFSGRNDSGKSTLGAHLVKEGGSYYSDEYAVFDTSGRVHPLVKIITLPDSNGVGGVLSTDSSGDCGLGPAPVALIVHTRYQTGATWTPRSLTASQAMLAMIKNTVRAREKPEMMLKILSEVARTTSAIEGDHSEAREVIADILRRYGGRLTQGQTPLTP